MILKIFRKVIRAEVKIGKSTSSAGRSVWAAKRGKTGQNGHPKNIPGVAHFVERRYNVFLEVVRNRRMEVRRT